ncbi:MULTISPECIES: DUF7662 domain-containing protein [Halomonadaceae]|uniref:DUF7662 domain-containing protein n=1 Tax=Vreelandella halophila TaxID=86177 RepID=A0A9X5B5N8_9GAMM|nr:MULTISPECIES: hypothetical protein [Halomonas]MYL26683.1 hypothetical protein [Halomonas utahensis]MYL75500.1 hypothetical protein [Halomonas sp. 22501_18_FS]
MESITIELSDNELEQLDEEFPEGQSSGVIGKRAERIVEIYLRQEYPGCEVTRLAAGADLSVRVPGGEEFLVEVKGAASSRIEWGQLKVSSQSSYNSLSEEGTPIYRVCSVFDANPRLYVLRFGEDFRLEAEPRWAVKPEKSELVELDEAYGEPGPATKRVRTSKYAALRDFLERQTSADVTIRFDQFPELVGIDLPRSAFEYQAYWANQKDTINRPWAKAWREAGFAVRQFKLGQDGWVQFRRE